MSITFWFNAYSMQKCLLSLLPLWRGFLNEENILFLIIFPQQVPVSFPGSSDGKESACRGSNMKRKARGHGNHQNGQLDAVWETQPVENPGDRFV